MLARIVQHEIDHLDGRLILDRATPEERRRVLKELRERTLADGLVNFAFAGTPDFAAWTLEHLVELGRRPSSGHLAARPARWAGDGGRPRRRRRSPPGAWASTSSRPTTSTPPRSSSGSGAAGREVLVVAAFGQILRADAARFAASASTSTRSLLPAYRGAAPIERALAAGETATGVSIMRMTAGLGRGSLGAADLPVGGPPRRRRLRRPRSGRSGRPGRRPGADRPRGRHGRVDRAGGRHGLRRQARRRGLPARSRPGRRAPCTTRCGRSAREWGRGRRAAGCRFKVWRTWPYGQPGLDAGAAGGRGRGRAAGRARPPLRTGCSSGCAEGAVELLLRPARRQEQDERRGVPAGLPRPSWARSASRRPARDGRAGRVEPSEGRCRVRPDSRIPGAASAAVHPLGRLLPPGRGGRPGHGRRGRASSTATSWTGTSSPTSPSARRCVSRLAPAVHERGGLLLGAPHDRAARDVHRGLRRRPAPTR